MESFNGKKKLTINLSLFTNIADSFSLTSPSNKSPRTFQNTSVVGLSIVAAMTDSSKDTNGNILSSPISRPVPIACSSSAKKPRVFNLEKQKNNMTTDDDHQVDELSENYTCVITHFGNNLVHKRVFFDDDDDVNGDGDVDDEIGNYSVFFASSSPLMTVGFELKKELWSRDFLSSCFLCNKKLHGLDIFMYRGEKAFCSAECRDKQIRSDDLKENYGSEARKQLDYLVSPCSGPPPQPPPIFAGVAVACANF